MHYIEDFKESDHVVDHYLCKQKQTLKTRSGKNYLSLRLQDKTGYIDAKVWEMSNDIHNFEENDFIKVDGVVLTYQNDLQLKVNKIRKSVEGEYDPSNYIPRTEKDIDALMRIVTETIKSVSIGCLKQLMENIFLKNPEINAAFQRHSAAKNMHHNYLGGLIEHTVSVMQICEFMSGRHKFINRDLLVCSALLHDIGKIYELSDFPDNEYTDDGQLLGHIMMGADLVKRESDKIPDFPHQLQSLLVHSILAHHGEFEYGSPKRPNTIEAYILHCADNMDAKIKMFEDSLSSSSGSGKWVGFNRMIDRNVRKSQFD
ncbi:MAG: HD domain-containing protein [Clostridiales bacterium]|jgi:3'-5' exoribonuclease|nr:HD domain-containing protein [Clostridiales bacterium]MDR2751932.1 HD domain-containing protein [Clostridiales bacterium]